MLENIANEWPRGYLEAALTGLRGRSISNGEADRLLRRLEELRKIVEDARMNPYDERRVSAKRNIAEALQTLSVEINKL